MANPFHGRVAVVTGASSGIGKALAVRLAREGCRVGLVARRREVLDELAARIRADGGTCAVASADVASRDDIHAAVAALRDQLGPVDYLIANAGVGTPTLLDPLNVGDVERMFRVNVFGVIYSIEAVLPEMLRRRSGHVAAVSSLAAFKGLPGESAYCATKAAVNAYLEGLRIQLREHNVAVTAACPGFVETPMTAVNDFHMPFLISAERAAEHIVRALRRRRKVHRFPLGMSLLTRLLKWLPDWAIARSMRSYNEKPPMVELK
jgi:short-subunit dehydrogenase